MVRSSSLVPANDPTLLFTNAGMVQFKDVFLGLEKRDYSRAASSQKCVRAGGKHNDLENVGYTRRHHTFFEMLGNFSFGDYFKADAIRFAWDLITKEYGLPKEKLYVTVFREDDDAEQLWQSVAGVPKDRIFRLDEADNFWQMGDTGPCGPCSEIHYDLGVEAAEPGREQEQFPSDAGGRYVEIWNLVFMQYDRDASGKLTPLPRPSIDTGMGLERVAAVLQGKLSNYETDLIYPIIEHAAGLFNVTPGSDSRVDTALRIAADHARAAAFLIHDGVIPSNEGRGYVLRKIMRRAMRNARLVGVEEPFLYKLTGFVAEHMQDAYPEMLESVQRVARVVKDEEHRYATTFLEAEKQFNAAIQGVDRVIPGAAAFKLYDTYGLALDEQEDMAREHSLAIDRAGFEQEMEHQRERARASWKGAEKGVVVPGYQKLLEQGRTKFLGYSELEATSRVIGLLIEKQLVEEVPEGVHAELVFDQTPFYAEAGGQVGDRGALYSDTGEKVAEVQSTFPGVPGLYRAPHRHTRPDSRGRHPARRSGRPATRVHPPQSHRHAPAARFAAAGSRHARQAGRQRGGARPPALRFHALRRHGPRRDRRGRAPHERRGPEEHPGRNENHAARPGAHHRRHGLVRRKVRRGGSGRFRARFQPRTLRRYARAPHRRYRHLQDRLRRKHFGRGAAHRGHHRRHGACGNTRNRRMCCGGSPGSCALPSPNWWSTSKSCSSNERALEKQVEQLKNKLAQSAAGDVESRAHTVKDSRVVAARLDGMDRQQMRALADSLRNKWKSAVVVLASAEDGSVSIVSAVTKDLTAKVHAGKLVVCRGASRRRQGRRPPRHGRRRRQGSVRARCRSRNRLPRCRIQDLSLSIPWSSAPALRASPAASNCRTAASKPSWWIRGAW